MNLLRNPSRTKTVASVAAIFLLGTLVTATFASKPSYAASRAAAGVVIPLYTYPDSSWTTIAQTAAAYPNVPIIAVVNPGSGPGSSVDPNYVANIQSLQSVGVKVLGYVATGYATSSYSAISNVESQVSDYSSWYHVNGIFFDEMSNTPGYENYYSTLNSFVKSTGMTYTMGNPGASVPSSYIGTLDDLVIYENAGYPSLSYITYPGYPSSDFSLIAYGVSYDSAFVANAAGLVGYMYLDDQSGSNPYSTLSSYFAQEVATLAGTASTTTTSSSSAAGTSSLTVTSTDTTGAAQTGYWTVLYDSTGTTTLASGFTPTTFTLNNGQSYKVQADGYGSCNFAYWKDNGYTNSLRSVSISANTDLDAVYNCGSSTTTTTTTSTTTRTTTTTFAAGITITVKSANLAGTALTGAPTTVKSSRDRTVASGYTTFVFDAKSGTRYSVCVSNYQTQVFSHWSDGSTSSCVSVTPSSSITMTAYFGGGAAQPAVSSGTPQLTVSSVGQTGTPVPGLWTTLLDSTGTTTIGSGFTPTSFTVSNGQSYLVEAGSYGACNFAFWQDNGNTDYSRTIAITGDTNLVAVYTC